MSLEKVGLFDMDGSLADYEGQLRLDLQQLQGPNEAPLNSLWTEEDRHAYMAARMRLIKNQPGWWLNLKPIANGMRVFRAARKMGFACNVLTKGPAKHPLAWAEKVQWCRQHLGEDVPVHVTSNKGLVYGKFLYDDFPEYCLDWLEHRPRGLVIMPVSEANKDFNHPQVLKWTGENWAEVKRALRNCYRRQDREPMER